MAIDSLEIVESAYPAVDDDEVLLLYASPIPQKNDPGKKQAILVDDYAHRSKTVIHHLLSVVGVTYAMLTGEAQLYTFMVLISEATTPSINLRWYLEAAGMKRSRAYILNGVVMFSAWLVARILLFLYLFYHAFLYRDQLMQIRTTGLVLVMAVPLVLSVMNLLWFRKIFKGLKKTLEKRD